MAAADRRRVASLLTLLLLLAGGCHWLAATAGQRAVLDAGIGAPPPPSFDVGKGGHALAGAGGSAPHSLAPTPARAAADSFRALVVGRAEAVVLAAQERLLLLGRLLLDGG